MLKKISLISTLFYSINIFALVDYSDESENRTDKIGRALGKNIAAQSTSSKEISINSSPNKYIVSLGGDFIEAKTSNVYDEKKVSMYNLKLNVVTAYDLYFNLGYWYAAGKDGKFYSGNPSAKVGFNWLRFGSDSLETRIDLIGGLSFSGSKSEYASKHNDWVIGLETSKRFGMTLLGISHHMTVAGKAQGSGQLEYQGIQTTTLALGHRVSSDIAFEVQYYSYLVQKAKKSESNSLDHNVRCAVISPSLLLSLSSNIELNLGATFRDKKVNSDASLYAARLWELKGFYGNTLFANLGMSF